MEISPKLLSIIENVNSSDIETVKSDIEDKDIEDIEDCFGTDYEDKNCIKCFAFIPCGQECARRYLVEEGVL